MREFWKFMRLFSLDAPSGFQSTRWRVPSSRTRGEPSNSRLQRTQMKGLLPWSASGVYLVCPAYVLGQFLEDVRLAWLFAVGPLLGLHGGCDWAHITGRHHHGLKRGVSLHNSGAALLSCGRVVRWTSHLLVWMLNLHSVPLCQSWQGSDYGLQIRASSGP